MQSRIVELSRGNLRASVYRGFLRISEGGTTVADLPMDDICAVMSTSRLATYTQPLMGELCENGIPLVIVGNNYNPVGIMTPLVGNYKQMAVQQSQISISKPLQKQLWASIIREKIRNQSKVLDLFGMENKVKVMIPTVTSGDTNNIEAIAARVYFPALFGRGFLRNTAAAGINSFLNYGYAVLRGALARQVVAAGLNPSFGIAHHNKLNPMCLVDDLIEPYRPIVDKVVFDMFPMGDDERELGPGDKKRLAGIIDTEMRNHERGMSPLIMIMQRDVWNFVNSIKEKKNLLEFADVI